MFDKVDVEHMQKSARRRGFFLGAFVMFGLLLGLGLFLQ